MKRGKSRRRRRCAECNALFDPDPRVGKRQKYCSDASCQRARRRAYQQGWRAAHPSEERGRRLREALQQASSSQARPRARPREPLASIPWDEVESELGAPTSVVLMCVMGVVVRWLVRSSSAHGGALMNGLPRSAENELTASHQREIPPISELADA